MARKTKKGLYEYFDEHNVWDKPDEVKEAAKRLYRKQYKAKWKKAYRKKNREITVCFPHEVATKVETEAKLHHRSLSEFVRVAVTSYFDRTYIVPNEHQVVQAELAIRDCLNQLIQLRYMAPETYADHAVQFQRVEQRVLELDKEITRTLRKPRTLQESIETAPGLSSTCKAELIETLSKYAHQN